MVYSDYEYTRPREAKGEVRVQSEQGGLRRQLVGQALDAVYVWASRAGLELYLDSDRGHPPSG